jgi:hypothetical protein
LGSWQLMCLNFWSWACIFAFYCLVHLCQTSRRTLNDL